MSFFSIALRSNAAKIDKDWFNALRTAGVALETAFAGISGGGSIPETTIAIVNNQASPANVAGLVFDPSLYGAFSAEYRVYRKTTSTGATELSEAGTLRGTFSPVANSWEFTQDRVGDAGVAFTVTALGQVRYTSSNITGTASISKMTFRAKTLGV